AIGIGLTTWSPLSSGLLTGKYRAGIPQGSRGTIGRMSFLVDMLTDREKNAVVASLEPVARELGCTLAQLAIAWCLKNPHVSSVITGASRGAQVIENMKAAELVEKLTPEVIEKIEKAVGNKPAAA